MFAKENYFPENHRFTENKIDAIEAFKTANTQPYSHIHSPGAVGGHCIPFYPFFVMDDDTRIIRLARELNDSIPSFLVGFFVLDEGGLAFGVSSVGVPYYVRGVCWDVFDEFDEDGGFKVDLVEC